MNSATSQIQKHFQIHNIYKRSKHFYDIEKLKEEQHLQQVYRRKPANAYSIETLDTRVDQSFVNLAQEASKKLQNQINQYKRKYQQDNSTNLSISNSNQKYDYQTQITLQQRSQSMSNRIKAPDLSKMRGRQQSLVNKAAYNNQSQFNNYKLSHPHNRAQLNFSLNYPRSKSSLSKQQTSNPQQLNLPVLDSMQILKLHNKNYYDMSIYKCLFDYSKVDKYANSSRKQKYKIRPKMIQQFKILSGQKITRIDRSPGLKQFYLSSSKQSPAQLSYRYGSEGSRNAQYSSPKNSQVDFGTRKQKHDMILKRLSQILDKKKIVDNREQLCDYKFFNRESYRKQ